MFLMGCFLPHFGRHGACYDITKSADSQTNKHFSDNDRITQNSTKPFIKQTISDSAS